jgi:hypothetical protein
MSDRPMGEGWWQASDSRWYPPDQRPGASLPPPPGGGASAVPQRPTATAAFAVGVAGAVLGLIPVLGVFAMFPGGLAIILGGIGLLRKPQRAKLAPAAIVLGAIAVGLAIYGIVQLQNVEDDLNDVFGSSASAQVIVGSDDIGR